MTLATARPIPATHRKREENQTVWALKAYGVGTDQIEVLDVHEYQHDADDPVESTGGVWVVVDLRYPDGQVVKGAQLRPEMMYLAAA